jgi:hypothetical protein
MIAYKVLQRLGTGETMRRREFIALMGASVTWPFAGMAQQPGRGACPILAAPVVGRHDIVGALLLVRRITGVGSLSRFDR